MYMIHTRPDICYAVIAMSQFMTEPRQRHWVAAKHILRYLRGIITYGLRYTSSGGLFLHGYADADWVGNPMDRKSTSRYCFSWVAAKHTHLEISQRDHYLWFEIYIQWWFISAWVCRC
jgi:hypothetical protein